MASLLGRGSCASHAKHRKTGRHKARRSKTKPTRNRWIPRAEELEPRLAPATVTVQAGAVVRPVNQDVIGANTTNFDGNLDNTTQQLAQAAGLHIYRITGGGNSDDIHFNDQQSGSQPSPGWLMSAFAAQAGVDAVVTTDYGSGSPQEAAAYLAYCNGSTANNTTIGVGPQWNQATMSWVMVNWQTVAFWAGLRAAAPLAADDGLNYMRANHPASYGFHYWEIGNELYFGIETDHHPASHDPATYVQFAAQFGSLAQQIDPTISVGLDAGGTNASFDGGWITNILGQCAAQGFVPGFLSDHSYMQYGPTSDSTLLLNTVSAPGSRNDSGPPDWVERAGAYRSVLQNVLGGNASRVQLLATEYNSFDPNVLTQQTTSLVTGLWVADSIGSLLQSTYDAAMFWDLRNDGFTASNVAGLYGWRKGSDEGLLGSAFGGPAGASPPATGTYVPYPSYFAMQLASKMIHNGDTVVAASSDDPNLAVYAVVQQNGDLALLVINKSPSSDLTGQFNISGFTPSGASTLYQYGTAQDDAQSMTADGSSSLAQANPTLSVTGSSFSFGFPHYSMTVLDLKPTGGGPPPPPPPATGFPLPSRVFVSAADAGGGPDTKVFNADGSFRAGFFAFDMRFTGGVRVAVGDVNGDGFPDVICAAGPGGGPNVIVFSGKDRSEIANFFAYDMNFTGGVYVAAGDVNGDGFADIICGADAGGGPNVTVFKGAADLSLGRKPDPILSYFPYDIHFTGGVRVAAGDVDADGRADIVTGAGPGGGPNVTVYQLVNGQPQVLQSYFAFDLHLSAGLFVGAGDVNGDGRADVIAGSGALTAADAALLGAPAVAVFSGADASLLNRFTPFGTSFLGAVRVAATDLTGSGRASVIAVHGPGGTPDVDIFNGLTGQLLDRFFAYDPNFTGGIYLANTPR